jgi:hypothetical protein
VQHKREGSTDILSVLRQNLKQTSAQINNLLLMGDEDERRVHEDAQKNQRKRVRVMPCVLVLSRPTHRPTAACSPCVVVCCRR